ncbi:DUF58 domain-containing protein [Okibacterium endophyticum]
MKTKLSIRAHRRVRGLLDGEYRSIFQGKSHEFDDLRPYVPGDEIKDIDWKATARHGSPLIKRYVATRKHSVLLVVDTGRNFSALGADGVPKRETAILAAGVMGYLAVRHGDHVGLVSGDSAHTDYLPLRGTESHLERILSVVHGRTALTAAPSELGRQLGFVARTVKGRMIVVVIADDRALSDEELRLLRRLHAQHEMLWLTIGDADLMRPEYADRDMFDVADNRQLPEYVRHDAALREEFAAVNAERARVTSDALERLGIANQRIEAEAEVVPKIFRLIEKHNHARR